MNTKNFFKTTSGRYVIIAIIAALLWGVALTLWLSGSDAAAVVILICAFFGWKALNRIQPKMFLWMSWVGWLIYFLVKFILAALVGLFVAPFVIGNYIGNVIADNLR